MAGFPVPGPVGVFERGCSERAGCQSTPQVNLQNPGHWECDTIGPTAFFLQHPQEKHRRFRERPHAWASGETLSAPPRLLEILPGASSPEVQGERAGYPTVCNEKTGSGSRSPGSKEQETDGLISEEGTVLGASFWCSPCPRSTRDPRLKSFLSHEELGASVVVCDSQ